MPNPYRSQTTHSGKSDRLRQRKTPVVLALSGIGFVSANYGSATFFSLSWHAIFTHVVFCCLPISLGLIAIRLTSTGEFAVRLSRTITWLSFTLISVSLAIGIAPCIAQTDPLDAFLAANYFFGDYGIYPWFWWIFCGLLPLVLTVRTSNARTWMQVLASLGILTGHAHNAWFTWTASHMTP